MSSCARVNKPAVQQEFLFSSHLLQVKKVSLCCHTVIHLASLFACYFLFYLHAFLLIASFTLLSRLPVPNTADLKGRRLIFSLLGRKIRPDSSAERTVTVTSQPKLYSYRSSVEILQVYFSCFQPELVAT